MAFKNKIIRNPKTRQDIRFLQTSGDTGGRLLEMESTYHELSKEPAAHYHPYQDEDFLLVSGELTVRMDGVLRTLRSGETIHIPKNKIHSMWNSSNGKTVVNWRVQPALQTEYFLETVMGLAGDGKTNDEGMPGILQVSLLATHFSDTFRLASPPFLLQKVLFTLLTPFAYFAGYRPKYKRYINL
jgi:quercetin dioxygenase-like cupin family protein